MAPSAVCFCGTLLTVTRTGRYPASLVFREPGLSSGSQRNPQPPRRLLPASSLCQDESMIGRNSAKALGRILFHRIGDRPCHLLFGLAPWKILIPGDSACRKPTGDGVVIEVVFVAIGVFGYPAQHEAEGKL